MSTAEAIDFRDELRSTARAFLARHCPPATVRAIGDGADGSSLRAEIAALGWLGVEVPEAHGGLGAGAPELMVLLEECGRALVPVPVLAPAALGVGALLAAPEPLQAEWLPRLAAGDAVVTAALGGPDGVPGTLGVSARADGERVVLSGVSGFVCDLPVADAVVVAAAEEGGGIGLFLVPAGTPGVTVEPLRVHDRTRSLGRLVLGGVAVAREQRVGSRAVAELLVDRGALAVAAESVGGADRVLEITLEHLRAREQFGRPLGSFQALKHRCADMFLALTAARSAVEHAASVLHQPVGRAAAVSIAKSCAAEAYAHIASEGVQMHGGIGFTWEHDMHLHLKRAKLGEALFGDADWHRDRIDRLIWAG
ncbi:MAG: acyl-CoA dehydrogenase family protein [Solirubrobacteraceae bacterium]